MIAALEKIAPTRYAESWDQPGLHIGSRNARVRRAMLCIDLTLPVVNEAIEHHADFIIAYHPPIFKPLPRLTDDHHKAEVALLAARHNISVYAPHTALDATPNGLNDFLADLIGPGRVRPIIPAPRNGTRNVKLVTFVPEKSEDRVRNALTSIGAGLIGDYEACSFVHAGHGTFRGLPSANPTVGRAGQLERVPEIRLEMILPHNLVADAARLLRSVHPYEEPAFDIIPLEQPPDTPSIAGQGRILELKRVTTFARLIERLKKGLNIPFLKAHRPARKGSIRTIGLCAGAGGSLIEHAGPIDVFFTGEMRHHDALDAVEQGIGLILAGHTNTERVYLPAYRERILAEFTQAPPDILIARTDKPPVETV
ncbi:Putative GTP cyclohydrolase 1 type 2 [Mucisphaera calidilacus]|uniref:GTP cyclohydrolase 1 type 2 homolog n=2 Tax=Mucisphaera calidilacus TaxID=2527982 RepID=A0A518BXH9_9BACT|nr:Putative GTP cyclohydrolase 1 type 2 [Mucisphaera calidilacus]